MKKRNIQTSKLKETLAIVVIATAFAALCGATPIARSRALIPRRINESFLSITGIHTFKNGRVIVLDSRARRVVLLDSTLTSALVLDAVGAGSGLLSSRVVALTGLADTAFLVDVSSGAISLIDAQGHLIESFRNSDLSCAVNTAGTSIQIANPRLLYCESIKSLEVTTEGHWLTDSSTLLEYDLVHERVRSLTAVQTGTLRISEDTVYKDCTRTRYLVPAFNPFPVVDFWRVLPDNNVIMIDGKSLRVSLVDSARTARNILGVLSAATIHASAKDMEQAIDRFKSSLEDRRRAMKEVRINVADTTSCLAASGVLVRSLSGVVMGDAWQFAGLRAGPPLKTIAIQDFSAEHSELRAHETFADRENNLWVSLTGSMSDDERRYVVVSKYGKEINTFTLQNGRRLIGFDQSNRAIISVPSAGGRFTIERAAMSGSVLRVDSAHIL